jgi:hypothetical protein
MSAKICMFAALLLAAVSSTGQTCKSGGDCQTGAIAGPFTAAQVAVNSMANPFIVCTAPSCTTIAYKKNEIEGIDAQQNIGGEYQFFDQAYNLDANIAVGPTVTGQNAQILEWVDTQYVQAFDKVTGQPIFTISGGTTAVPQSVLALWNKPTQGACYVPSGNVQVIFDRLDKVFIISRRVTFKLKAGGVSHYAWCIAASSTSDLSNPSTQWHAYEYIMDTVLPCVPSSDGCTTGTVFYYYPDWPRIGTWSNGFYVAFDLLDQSDGSLPDGVETCQLDRADIVQGKASQPMTCYTYMISTSQSPSLIHSLDVADIDSSNSPPTGEPEYFLSMVNPSNAQQSGNGQGVCTSQATPCTSNQLALFTWGTSGLAGPTFVTVDPYTPGCYDTSGAGRETNTICVPVPSTNIKDIGAYGQPSCFWFNTPCVDSLGDRMANRLPYNHLLSKTVSGEFLTASHVVLEGTNDQRTGIRYYVLRVSNGNASVLVNSGSSSGPPDLEDSSEKSFYFMPSTALDKDGNLAFTYTSSGKHCHVCTTQYHPSIYFAALPWGASKFSVNSLIIQGTGDEQNTFHWGEYAATVLDSSNGLEFYGVGEYFKGNQSGLTNCTVPSSNCYLWKTRIFREKVAP